MVTRSTIGKCSVNSIIKKKFKDAVKYKMYIGENGCLLVSMVWLKRKAMITKKHTCLCCRIGSKGQGWPVRAERTAEAETVKENVRHRATQSL